MARPDIRVENHGSLFLLWPATKRAACWLDGVIAEDAQYCGDAVVVEPRYIRDIVNGARDAGLEVR